MEKVLLISDNKDGFVLTADFSRFPLDKRTILSEYVDWAIRDYNAFSEPISETEALICVENKQGFLSFLKKCGFTIQFSKKLNLKIKIKQKEIIPLRCKPKNSYITLQLQDLSEYFNGKGFKGFETLLENPKITVEKVIENALSTITTRGSSAFTTVDFISRIEETNRLLCRLQADIKTGTRLDFLKTRRTPELYAVYEELYSYDLEFEAGEVVTLSSGDWTLIDGHRIYDLIYKFGTKNAKICHKYKDKLLFRSFRGDFVFMLDESVLENQQEKEIRVKVKPLISLLGIL
jgi:hypothetical protein